MKQFSSLFALSFSVLPSLVVPHASFASSTQTPITGTWHGVATVRGTQVPKIEKLLAESATTHSAELIH